MYENVQGVPPPWEYRTRDVQNIMHGVAQDHPNLGKASLQRIKALLSGIFRHAVVAGFREGNAPSPG